MMFLAATLQAGAHQSSGDSLPNYLQNRLPLREKPYLDLPFGSIQPKGWLKENLIKMKDGMCGNLDELYPAVLGKRNGWLGGDGDVWERGPYWLDGLAPLAYILDDKSLQKKLQPWIEWSIANQMARFKYQEADVTVLDNALNEAWRQRQAELVQPK